MGNPYAPPGENPAGPDAPPAEGRPDPAAWPAAPPPHQDRWPSGDRPPTGDGGPGGSPAPPEGPPRTPAEIEATRVASRRALRFYAFLAAGLLTLPLPVPWQGASLVFVLIAIGVGVHGFVQAWRGGVRGSPLAALGVMVAVAGLVAMMVASLLAVWPEQLARQRCLADALTIAATRACDVQFEEAVSERLGGMGQTPASS